MSVITAVVRGDAVVTSLILDYDAKGQPLVIPALAMTAASIDMRTEEGKDLLVGLEALENVVVAPLRDAEQAARLATVIAKTGVDPWDAHVAAVADASVCPILTLDAAKWLPHTGDLDEPLHIVEIADPEGEGPRLACLFIRIWDPLRAAQPLIAAGWNALPRGGLGGARRAGCPDIRRRAPACSESLPATPGPGSTSARGRSPLRHGSGTLGGMSSPAMRAPPTSARRLASAAPAPAPARARRRTDDRTRSRRGR